MQWKCSKCDQGYQTRFTWRPLEAAGGRVLVGEAGPH